MASSGVQALKPQLQNFGDLGAKKEKTSNAPGLDPGETLIEACNLPTFPTVRPSALDFLFNIP